MKTTEEIKNMHPDALVSWFMIGSYAYYKLDENVMSDYDFDFLVKRLKEEWDNINHPHKELITLTNLDSGSGYDINFPSMVKGATVSYLNRNNKDKG
tara:strand:+ start:165 stop:455 length:291 start_codon:yes stop_codon:yes gene_type:complete